MEPERVRLMLSHYRAQRVRVEAFLAQHGEEWTTRQGDHREWTPCKWRALCQKAISYYTDMIQELEAGTYRWSTHVAQGLTQPKLRTGGIR